MQYRKYHRFQYNHMNNHNAPYGYNNLHPLYAFPDPTFKDSAIHQTHESCKENQKHRIINEEELFYLDHWKERSKLEDEQHDAAEELYAEEHCRLYGFYPKSYRRKSIEKANNAANQQQHKQRIDFNGQNGYLSDNSDELIDITPDNIRNNHRQRQEQQLEQVKFERNKKLNLDGGVIHQNIIARDANSPRNFKDSNAANNIAVTTPTRRPSNMPSRPVQNYSQLPLYSPLQQNINTINQQYQQQPPLQNANQQYQQQKSSENFNNNNNQPQMPTYKGLSTDEYLCTNVPKQPQKITSNLKYASPYTPFAFLPDNPNDYNKYLEGQHHNVEFDATLNGIKQQTDQIKNQVYHERNANQYKIMQNQMQQMQQMQFQQQQFDAYMAMQNAILYQNANQMQQPGVGLSPSYSAPTIQQSQFMAQQQQPQVQSSNFMPMSQLQPFQQFQYSQSPMSNINPINMNQYSQSPMNNINTMNMNMTSSPMNINTQSPLNMNLTKQQLYSPMSGMNGMNGQLQTQYNPLMPNMKTSGFNNVSPLNKPFGGGAFQLPAQNTFFGQLPLSPHSLMSHQKYQPLGPKITTPLPQTIQTNKRNQNKSLF